jgi:hypothetical protein
VCRPPSADNKLQNPGFEQPSALANWIASPGASWSSDDADACTGSGSTAVMVTMPQFDFGNIAQCVPATAGTRYFFGFKYKQQNADGVVCYLWFYAGSTCSGNILVDGSLTLQGTSVPVTFWQLTYDMITAPPTTGSAKVFCQTSNGTGAFDQIYVNPISNSY